MISDHPIIKKIAWTSGTRRAGASMETHREYVGYLDERDGAERLTDEEIVRCRDCKFSINDGMQCRRHKDSGWNGNAYCEEYAYVNPDGYCAWGESKEATEL